jgi:hypothetical protein
MAPILTVIGVDPVSIDPTPISVPGRFLPDHHLLRPLRLQMFTHDSGAGKNRPSDSKIT